MRSSLIRVLQGRRGLVTLGVLALALYHGYLLGHSPRSALATGKGGVGLGGVTGPYTLRLHGSTPTLAWSPDSTRVAVAASFEYYGFGELPKKLASQTGIYVVDPARRTSWRVSQNQGYHPTWLNARTLAWGISPYEHGQEGLYVASLSGTSAKTRRLGALKGVYHLGLAAKSGRLLLYSGFPEDRGWVEVDPRTAAITARGGAGAKGVTSWNPPPGSRQAQCLQQVGKVRSSITSGGQILLETKSQNVMIPEAPFSFYTYNGTGRRRSCAAPGHCGPVAPCLSPKGDRVAYVSQGAQPGTFVLSIMDVPP